MAECLKLVLIIVFLRVIIFDWIIANSTPMQSIVDL